MLTVLVLLTVSSVLALSLLTVLTVLALLMVLRVLMLLAMLTQLDGFGCADIQSCDLTNALKVSQLIENLHCVAALKLAAAYIPQ